MSVSIDLSLATLVEKIRLVEDRIKRLESDHSGCPNSQSTALNNDNSGDDDSVARVKSDLVNRQIFSSRFIRVPSDYYERTLQERAALLNCQTYQLCKR